jgi:hypothetical protein
MPRVVHFWAEMAADFWEDALENVSAGVRPTRTESPPQKAAQEARPNGHSEGMVRVESLAHWVSLFRAALQANYLFDEVFFHAHAHTATLGVGRDVLSAQTLAAFENQGFEKAFNAGATFTFDGCPVGEGPHGEWFLAKAGSIFLKRGGGQVSGRIGLGPGFASGKSAQPQGARVIAKISEGGAVSLFGHSCLDPKAIEDRTTRIQMRLLDRATRKTPFNLKPALDALNNALTLSPRHGAYQTMFNACVWLDEAERELKVVDELMRRPSVKL